MESIIQRVLLSILMLSAGCAHADISFGVAPSLGVATIQNIDNYEDSAVVRIDGTFYPIQYLGVNIFISKYQDFESSGNGNDVVVKLNGGGVGVIGRWPVHPHVQPYLRVEYFKWDTEATGLGRTLGEDDGGSAGLAVGAQFPIRSFIGVKAEVSGYNDVSGADIRQITVGAIFEF